MIDGISFIGVDEQTDLTKLWELSELSEYADIEFGVLYSETKSASKDTRYPSLEWIKKFCEQHTENGMLSSTSLHLCGSVIEKYLNGDENLVALVNNFDRVQLNFAMAKFNPDDLTDNLLKLTKKINAITVLQLNKSKESFIKSFVKKVPEADRPLFNILYDGSGGFGRVLETPQKPLDNFFCGYAGGIGPETVKTILDKIDAITDQFYYIDMESKIREDNYFSIEKCEQVIDIVNEHIGNYNE